MVCSKILDTSELITLLEVLRDEDLMQSFSKAGYQLVVTNVVRDEFCVKGDDTVLQQYVQNGVMRIAGVVCADDLEFKSMAWGLDKGEISVIDYVMGNSKEEVYPVVGETSARSFLKHQEGIPFCGIVGLIGRLARKGLVGATSLKRYYDRIIESGIRISPKLMREEWNLK